MSTDIIQSLRQQLNVTYVKPDPSKVDIFIEDLQNNQISLDYLKIDRGFTDETIKHFKLGYSKDKDAISIPIFKNGECINIKYRLLNPKTIKYTQEKGCEVWLYNEEGIDVGKKKGGVMISEGEFDCMSIWQSGIKNVVSPASGKDSYGVWIELIDNIPKIYIAYDNDKPGKKASKNMADRLGVDKSFEIQYPEEIKDANDYFKEHTPEDFRELVKKARPFYKYEFKGLGDIIEGLQQKTLNFMETRFFPNVKMRKDWLVVVSGKTGSGKCHAKGTKLLMFDGSIKNVEDVVVGDKLMGQDSNPRNILSLANGKEEMYRVNEGDTGEYYDVNESHIISIKRVGWDKKNMQTKIMYHEKTIKELLEIKPVTRRHYRGWKTDIDFKEQEIKLDPYFLGIWLGDGTSSKPQITSMDKVIKDFIFDYSHNLNLDVTVRKQPKNKSVTMDIINKTRKEGSNYVLNNLRDYNLIDNKHIPNEYKINSYSNRLEVLAGLLDSDGYLGGCKVGTWGEYFEIIQKNTKLANDIVFLARSLGFRVKIKKVNKGIKSINFMGEYNRIFIFGDLSKIPTKLKRKQTNFCSKKDWMTHRLEIEPLGIGEYFGFTLDGDGLYVLENFTVTHNTSFILNVADDFIKQDKPVLVMPFERGINDVGHRMMNVMFNKTTDDFLKLERDDWDGIIKDCVDKPLYFSVPKKNDVIDTIRKAKKFFDIQVVIVDHLDYLIRHTSGNREAEIANTLQEIKGVAQELDIVMIIVTHIRKIEQAGSEISRKPNLDDLKGSSSLSQDPECVILLNPVDEGVDVCVAKNKGRMGCQTFDFVPETGRFSEEYDNPNLTEEENDLWNNN